MLQRARDMPFHHLPRDSHVCRYLILRQALETVENKGSTALRRKLGYSRFNTTQTLPDRSDLLRPRSGRRDFILLRKGKAPSFALPAPVVIDDKVAGNAVSEGQRIANLCIALP